MSDAPRSTSFDDVSGLLAYFEVDSLEAAAEVISEEIDPDAWAAMDGGEVILGIGTFAFVLEFPLSADDFWEMIRELECDATDAMASEAE